MWPCIFGFELALEAYEGAIFSIFRSASPDGWNQGPTRTLVHPGSYSCHGKGRVMDSIIYLVGVIVVIMFILSVLGLR